MRNDNTAIIRCADHNEADLDGFSKKQTVSITVFHDLRQLRYTLLRAKVPFALANKGKLWGELLDRESFEQN